MSESDERPAPRQRKLKPRYPKTFECVDCDIEWDIVKPKNNKSKCPLCRQFGDRVPIVRVDGKPVYRNRNSCNKCRVEWHSDYSDCPYCGQDGYQEVYQLRREPKREWRNTNYNTYSCDKCSRKWKSNSTNPNSRCNGCGEEYSPLRVEQNDN